MWYKLKNCLIYHFYSVTHISLALINHEKLTHMNINGTSLSLIDETTLTMMDGVLHCNNCML